jgi:hypothetical protein
MSALQEQKRRVAILINEDVPETLSFSECLSYEFQTTDLEKPSEFSKVTTSKDWFERGQALHISETTSWLKDVFTRPLP